MGSKTPKNMATKVRADYPRTASRSPQPAPLPGPNDQPRVPAPAYAPTSSASPPAPLARYVGHQQTQTISVQADHVTEVSRHRAGRLQSAKQIVRAISRKSPGQHRVLIRQAISSSRFKVTSASWDAEASSQASRLRRLRSMVTRMSSKSTGFTTKSKAPGSWPPGCCSCPHKRTAPPPGGHGPTRQHARAALGHPSPAY